MDDNTRIAEPGSEQEAERSFDVVSQTLRNVSQQLMSDPDKKSSETTQENIAALVRYKDWLETLKQMQNGVINLRTEDSAAATEPSATEDTVSRMAELQDEFLKESASHAVSELVVRSAQLGNRLQELLFPSPSRREEEGRGGGGDEENGEGEEERQPNWAMELCDKQRNITSNLLAHHQACQSLLDEIDQKQKGTRELQAANKELMQRLQAKESEAGTVDNPSRALKNNQEKLDDLISHISMETSILQGLIIGSGVNWAKDPALKDIVIALGQPPDLNA